MPKTKKEENQSNWFVDFFQAIFAFTAVFFLASWWVAKETAGARRHVDEKDD